MATFDQPDRKIQVVINPPSIEMVVNVYHEHFRRYQKALEGAMADHESDAARINTAKLDALNQFVRAIGIPTK